MPATDKHSSLLRKFPNYGPKKFYNIDTRIWLAPLQALKFAAAKLTTMAPSRLLSPSSLPEQKVAALMLNMKADRTSILQCVGSTTRTYPDKVNLNRSSNHRLGVK
jgi:hypothetical protein